MTYKELSQIGIKPERAKKHLDSLQEIWMEIKNSELAAHDMNKLRLNEKISKTENELVLIKEKEKGDLTEKRLKELRSRRDLLQERLTDLIVVSRCETKISKQKFNQSAKRLSQKLIMQNRLKGRKLEAGARRLLDSDDEEFITRAVESKSTSHGRRHDAILYTGYRVKYRDLLSLTDYSLYKKGKRLIRSASTVYNKGRLKRINSVQAKKHIGNWLFCAKKPPKTEKERHESTHHQRAHVKNNRLDMFGSQSIIKNASLDISMDHKAYVRPGTDVGFRETKAGVIIQLSDEELQRKLPEHDFPVKEVCQTPSSFRVMTWSTENVKGKENLIKEKDQSFVTIRPKHYVSSSGSTWASDLLKIRYEKPKIFEMESAFSEPIRRAMAIINDYSFYFIDVTNNDDLTSLLSKMKNHLDFKDYELQRLNTLLVRLQNAELRFKAEKSTCTNRQVLLSDKVFKKCSEIHTLVNRLIGMLQSDVLTADVLELYRFLTNGLSGIISVIVDSGLAVVKPVISEETDAGPGVGVSNLEVKMRFTELCRIQQSDRRIRLHRDHGDLGRNEAERTNSCIWDALVDGGAINWEKCRPYEGLTEEHLKEISIDELEKHKNIMMENNAWLVAEELKQRIDDEKGPGGDFMISYVTEKPEDHFFNNGHYLKQYHSSSDKAKPNIPGHGYFKKIESFLRLMWKQGFFTWNIENMSVKD